MLPILEALTARAPGLPPTLFYPRGMGSLSSDLPYSHPLPCPWRVSPPRQDPATLPAPCPVPSDSRGGPISLKGPQPSQPWLCPEMILLICLLQLRAGQQLPRCVSPQPLLHLPGEDLYTKGPRAYHDP